jgi:prephenate dehydratase
MKIGYLGPMGSFTYTAALTAFPKAELVAFSSIPACIKGVENAQVSLSIIPIENTIEGSVNASIDYLYHQSEITVEAELVLPIQQQLMVAKNNVQRWQQSQKIFSHPQALAQSQRFLTKYFPLAALEVTPSTAYAASYIAEHASEPLAAIAPKLSAEMYDLAIVQENIQDLAVNQTRFWVLGNQAVELPCEAASEKMSIAVTLPNNLPGALHKALSVFSWREISLSKIESRPLKTTLGEYFFLIDLLKDQPQAVIQNAFEELHLLGGTIKIFGNYKIYPLGSI